MTESKDYISLHCYRKRKLPEKPIAEDTLDKILSNLPQDVYQPSWVGAAVHLATGLSFLGIASLCYYLAHSYELWPLVSVGWVFGALSMLSFFNIGHDCSHKIWTPSTFVNDIMGELAFLPLMHPFAAFKFKHNVNKKLLKRTDLSASCDKNLLSHPSSSLSALGFIGFVKEYYWFPTFPKDIQPSVLVSISLSGIFFAILFSLGGLKGAIIYWLVPLILYKDVFYMKWLEWARKGLDIHFPPRIATSIPSYNLRAASVRIDETLTRPKQVEQVSLLLKDAEQQKLGAKKTGYDHQFGSEESPFPEKSEWRLDNINWVNAGILLGTPVAAVIGLFYVHLKWQTLVLSFIYYFFSGLGITAGYHRLFAHRAYEAVYLVRLFLVLGGTAALEGSVKWWCGGHRVHHRYTDSRVDPYNSKRGFWWAHMGWMMVHPAPSHKARADIRDLQADPIMNFQHTHYSWLGPFMAFGVPSLIAYFGWNDAAGGLVYAGICRLIFVHHATFCVNSMAHYFGSHTYDDERTPRDHIITALVTIGEGYHNFHHEFPNDYRNGIRMFDYDPTKWLIKALSLFGLTYNLKEFPANEISKGKLHMMEKSLQQEKAKLMYPADIKSLPEWSWEDIHRKVEMDQALVVVDGLVHDVSNFLPNHPGGVPLLRAAIGKDATDMFNGTTKVYKHSQAARHLLTTFRVARLPSGKAGQAGAPAPSPLPSPSSSSSVPVEETK